MFTATRSFATRHLRSKSSTTSILGIKRKFLQYDDVISSVSKRAKTTRKFSNQKLQSCDMELHRQMSNVIPEYNSTYYIKSWRQKPNPITAHILQAQLINTNEAGETQVSINGKMKTLPSHVKMWKIKVLYQNGTIKEHLIDYDDYIRVYPKDNFTSDHVYLSPPKWKRNWSFVSNISRQQEMNPRPFRRVVYLDAPEALTTNMLVSSGLFSDPSQLHVPNVNPEFLAMAQKNFESLATFRYCSFYEWLRDFPTEEIKDGFDVGADYCSTFSGNSTLKPKIDLTVMFQRSILARKGGVLWLTFCIRPFCIESVKKSVEGWIYPTAKENGYTLNLLDTNTYNGMIYYMFVTV